MRIHTSSEGVSLAKRLENDSAQFYGEASERYQEAGIGFSTYQNENRRHVRDIERTYYGVITDAIEGGYCLDVDSAALAFDPHIATTASVRDTLVQAADIEGKIETFYRTAGDQMAPLMADLGHLFRRLAKRHHERLVDLGRQKAE